MRIPAQRIEFAEEDRQEILARIAACLEHGQVAQGRNVAEFEEAFAVLAAAKYAIAVSSGGAALEVLMHLLGVTAKEVIVPTNTFIATAVSVMLAGGHLRLADVDPASFALSLESIKANRTERTAGVIVVHIGGIVTSEIIPIRDYCTATGLWLVEDCAHAHGSVWESTAAGLFGLAGAYSFFATKLVTCGEGGMIVTNDESLSREAKAFRDYGKSDQWVSLSQRIGCNRRMSEFCAAVGVVHLGRLEEAIARRRSVAERYTAALGEFPRLHPVLPLGRSSWYKYIVLLPEDIPRVKMKQALSIRGIDLAGGVYEVPLHEQPALHYPGGHFPIAEDVCARHICLPIHSVMKPQEVEHVVAELGAVVTALEQE